jgi:hypothetical protein
LIKGKIAMTKWLAFLDDLATILPDDSSQLRMVLWLQANGCHFIPELTFPSTGIRVSSRVEGFFGTLKKRIEHQRLSLADLASVIRLLAQECLRKRIKPRQKPVCGRDIMSILEQLQIGCGAARVVLRDEVRKLRAWNWASGVQSPREIVLAHQCCEVAVRWK